MLKSKYKVIGVMSGTSLDGIDIIFATFDFDEYWKFEIKEAITFPYSERWKKMLSHLTGESMKSLQDLDEDYSTFLAEQIQIFIDSDKIEDIDFIASHGHTALHQPERGLTYQIGNRQIIADILKQKVICDFRVQDVEFGGQGAPLVPIGDRLLFHNYDFCLNLGGFANISYEEGDERIAFDICPVNIVLNHYVAQIHLEYDDKGQLAKEGSINEELLNKLNKIEFYKNKPPKSLGLEWVNKNIFPLIDAYQLELKDILATFVEHIAIQISKVLNISNKSVLVTGGGAYNDFLINRIQELSKTEIVIPSKEIIEYKEALVFGLLGVLKDRNEINCLKSVTGASQNHSSGKILIPKINN
ncbi:anhydro-N-acetylmuramic acid kinase [Winogradskyella sp. SYSU M77433]|uniref:anhydro-N-acetylmuramic acid kinase n=1 Tax=Winogradskyella sp. SYSU M77433 TaxID=3042722 RepID=UPI0024812ACC|nr:anhydro-N-acetylmuramic acid kinase [Winogradskyella sp. SYSU M77433]MDH7914611.1 anhydro-N-acetylmuramic acid kinase [Winogradskyella sp. SYSU M77433]